MAQSTLRARSEGLQAPRSPGSHSPMSAGARQPVNELVGCKAAGAGGECGEQSRDGPKSSPAHLGRAATQAQVHQIF